MSNTMRESRIAAQVVEIPGSLKKRPDRLPWPRKSADEPFVDLGIDVVARRQDIIKIVHKFFWVEDTSMDELLQEVYVAILHKNHTRSAHDPRKSSLGHYIYMVANNVCINLVHRRRRYEKERDSIDAPVGGDDARPLLDTIENASQSTDDEETVKHMRQVEALLRQNLMWDPARYLHSVLAGANQDQIREALSFGGRRVSSKTIRDIRTQVQTFIRARNLTT